MNYCIISIDDSRASKKQAIRDSLSGWTEHFPEFIDGRKPGEIEKWLRHDFIGWNPKLGEAGIWLSQINVWRYIVDNDLSWLAAFEDDAILTPGARQNIEEYMQYLPEDWDALALFTPENQIDDYRYDAYYDKDGVPHLNSSSWVSNENSPYYIGNNFICKAAQGYSGVAIMYSKKGAERLLKAVDERGLYSTSDCFLFLEAHTGRLNMYAVHPLAQRPVVYDWDNSPTLVQDTEKYYG